MNTWLTPHQPPDNRLWYQKGYIHGQMALGFKVIITCLIIGLTILLGGCMSMPDKKVEGVDNLKVTEHVLSTSEVTRVCGEKLGIPLLMRWMVKIWGCATIELDTWTCDIYYSQENLEGQSDLLEHERMHCQGYWHDNELQEYYDSWKAKQFNKAVIRSLTNAPTVTVKHRNSQ